jgi:type VI secretion system protein ImpG
MDDRYYTEELSYLLDLSKEFSHRHSDKAQMLHFEDVRSREPNLERLLESFAFLSSRIRKRLDDDFPQIADGLFSLVWPGYVNFLPSCCLAEFSPQAGIFTESATIPKGAMIDSEPSQNNIRCRFRTTLDVDILPIKLSKVAVELKGSTSVMTMTFGIFEKADRSSLANRRLRIHIVDDPMSSFQLFDLLLGMDDGLPNVRSITLSAFTFENESLGSWNLSHDAITPVGLTQAELLLPTHKSALWRFDLLREFFLFPLKFLAFELDVLKYAATHIEIDTFAVAFHIEREWPADLHLSKKQFRLNSVPIINLFKHEAAPIRLDGNTHQYTVVGDIQNPEYFQVYSIDKVESVEGGILNPIVYEPLYAADSYTAPSTESKRTYAVDRSKASWDGWETVIRFFNSSIDNEFSEEEIVSLWTTCTNGHLTDKLSIHQIHFPVSDIKEGLNVQNITPPTRFFVPDIENISLWRWMSHAALNTLSIQSSERFRSFLLLHDFTNADTNRRKVEGINSIHMKPIRVLSKGALISGIAVELAIQEDKFVHLGEIQLFARILSVFLTSYASMNSCIQLTVTALPSNHRIIFEPGIGEGHCL